MVLRLVVQDAVDKGRLEGTRRARDEYDVPAGDATVQAFIQADDVRGNAILRRHLSRQWNPLPTLTGPDVSKGPGG